MLTGTTPFFATDEMTVYENIIDGIERVKFPGRFPRNAEVNLTIFPPITSCIIINPIFLQLFVRNLCKLDPQNRLGNSPNGFNEIRKHRWFRGFHWEVCLCLRLLYICLIPGCLITCGIYCHRFFSPEIFSPSGADL